MFVRKVIIVEVLHIRNQLVDHASCFVNQTTQQGRQLDHVIMKEIAILKVHVG
jgi:hypothetical protein